MKTYLDNWKFVYVSDEDAANGKIAFSTAEEIVSSGLQVYDAVVPGSLELDLMRLGILPDLRVGENILLAQKLEDRHVWYFASFYADDDGSSEYLVFDGIDTAAEVFIDGEPAGRTENMFIPFRKKLNCKKGLHGVVVHIIPAKVYAAGFELPYYCNSLKYNTDQLKIRKAPYMFGWDIMPRCVSAGIWKPVYIEKLPSVHISDVFARTVSVGEDRAVLKFCISLSGALPFGEYRINVTGRCGDSVFEHSETVYSSFIVFDAEITAPRLWMPRNCGDANLYEISVELRRDGTVTDRRQLKTGIRITELERTSCAGEDGKFLIRVNGQPVFCMGSNWVPTDIFPSEQAKLNLRGLEMVKDLGCNIIRCWGGNIYPDDNLYDFCDENGILVWQDFAMACGIYPNDDRMCGLIKAEAEEVVKRLRNHPSVAVWSGDNECDQGSADCYSLPGRQIVKRKPDDNILTRKVIPEVLSRLDGTRPYIPSSPYIDNCAFENGHPAEDHLWGPRDYFKGDYYMNADACFVSETGYHGCPCRQSLEQFLEGDNLYECGDTEKCTNRQWLTHAASPVPDASSPYAYRIPLMTRQIERLFGKVPDSLDEYIEKSQLSQAEAFKFFIEHSRLKKWHRSGIIWWNIIDGWPQISDAVTDWYGRKKTAYGYIKTSQQPFCVIADEPKDGRIDFYAVNDLRGEASVNVTIKVKSTGKTAFSGSITVEPDGIAVLTSLDDINDTYLISWTGTAEGENHWSAPSSFRL